MHETPLSLLERLRLRPDPASWRRLVDLYTPFIRDWLRPLPLPPADRVRFDFGELGGVKVQQGPLIVFVELACRRGGQEVSESNTLAVLVTPREDDQ